MGYREIIAITTACWMAVSKFMIDLFFDEKPDKAHAVMIWIIVTGYMVFRAFVR